MPKSIAPLIAVLLCAASLLAGCTPAKITPATKPEPTITTVSANPDSQDNPIPTGIAPTPTKETRLLTICTGSEPASLFPYSSTSATARNIQQALYDGPYDTVAYELVPVIIEQVPLIENGGAYFEPVLVSPGEAIADNDGNPVRLSAGISYRPSGCTSPNCAQVFSGQDPILMDILVVRFQFLPNIQWSDGTPLTANDSLYAYQVAKALYPAYRPQLVRITRSYQVIDQWTIEWRGLPGSQASSYPEHFFAPLPQHAWGTLPMSELPESQLASQAPLGWGPYVLEEWKPGEQITFSKNPYYFRANEGLPYFDRLVFRFTTDPQETVQAVLAGECHLADETALRGVAAQELQELQSNDNIATWVKAGGAWEQILFGITARDTTRTSLFASVPVRQAIASCINKERISQEVYSGLAILADTFVLPDHPYYTSEAARYNFNPQSASTLLTASGWVDHDGDPATPRVASGVAGIPEGTPFEFAYLASEEIERQQVAQIVQESLAQCGIKVNLEFLPASQVYAGGPEGPIFGRHFDAAQLAWTTQFEVPCSLFTTIEIPGPYPAFPKGWGGANASGYSNPNLDQACATSLTTLRSSPDFTEAYRQIQLILSEELPALPLYLHPQVAAAQVNMCGFQFESSNASSLWNLEEFNYGDACNP